MSDERSTIFAAFWLYKVRAKFRQLEDARRERIRREFADTVGMAKGAVTLRGPIHWPVYAATPT